MFEMLDIPLSLVDIGMKAMEKHSQNDVIYNPKKAKNITEDQLKTTREWFEWLGAPVTLDIPLNEYVELMKIK